MNLLDLPVYMIEEILIYLSYDEIAKKRLVCTKIDKICQGLLNRGFNKMVKKHSSNLKIIKSQLPRRESERRNHPLSKHVDILTCIETRVSMLSMTYIKYIELDLCCFIPGKVIDEVLFLLNLVDKTTKPLRTQEVLQELRDISSMAIEHFDEKIANVLKKQYLDIQKLKQHFPPLTNPSPNTSQTSILLSSDLMFPVPKIPPIQQKNQQSLISPLSHHCIEAKKNSIKLLHMKRKYKSAIHLIKSLKAVQKKHAVLVKNNSIQISDLSTQIIELKRRLEEFDAKNRDMSTSFNENSGNSSDGGHINTSQNIKPRTATIILKRRIDEQLQNPACSSAIGKFKRYENRSRADAI